MNHDLARRTMLKYILHLQVSATSDIRFDWFFEGGLSAIP